MVVDLLPGANVGLPGATVTVGLPGPFDLAALMVGGAGAGHRMDVTWSEPGRGIRWASTAAGHRRDPHRRNPIVLTLLAQSATDVLDELVALFDQAVSARESRARHKLTDQLAERARSGEDKLALAEEILPVLADPAIPG